MLLYLCHKCHKWQDVSIGVFLTNTWNNAMKSIPDAKIPDPVGQPCPNGCGMMIQVKPEDKITLFKEPSGFVVFPPDYTFAECMKHQKEIKAELKQRDKLLEDARKLLNLYAEAAPWEHGLAATKDHLFGCIDALKKDTANRQEESTDLFDVVSKCMHNFPSACNVTAQSDKDKIMATYYIDTHAWELKVWRLQGKSIPIGETKLKTDLQAMAREHNIDLSKGWRVINHQYKY